MGESAALLAYPQRIDDHIHNRVLALASDLEEADIKGVRDVVPAYCSLLVQYDPLVVDLKDLRSLLVSQSRQDDLADATVGQNHIIPVHYGGEDGPDLARLAASLGMSQGQAIALHSGVPYRVYFLGFMPGFAYMGTVPSAIAYPRHATPRSSVPAGSVGIAGEQTGIYPLASPGGWQILGRTSVRVWDERRPQPSLLSAGDNVQFVPVESAGDTQSSPENVCSAEFAVFEVLEAAPGTLVIDLGRPGYARYGLSAGGAMDSVSAARANLLVGNAANAALLEMAHAGPTLRTLRTTTIALDGAELRCTVAGQRVPLRTSWLVRAGALITFQGTVGDITGFRGYLAVSGGIEVPEVLGSRSTYLAGAFGGHAGRPLQSGDVLGTQPVDYSVAMAGRFWPRHVAAPGIPSALRFLPYAGPNSVPSGVLAQFQSQSWRIGERTNRMGIQITPVERPLVVEQSKEALSFGVVRGAIQLPPDGRPFILAADHQTTGGYPLLGVVIEADWPVVAQLAPGSVVHFVETTVDEALAELARARQDLTRGPAAR